MEKYKYSDTTVKLESSVVREAAAVLEPGQTLTSYVRDVVYRDVKRRRLKQAARTYRDFLAGNPEERAELDAWESVDLASPPKATKQASRK